jgi:large subunit ribosomal protein L10
MLLLSLNPGKPSGPQTYADGDVFTESGVAIDVAAPNCTSSSGLFDAGKYRLSNPGVNPVAIGLEDKKAIVAEVNETATSALSLVIADSRGVPVDGMTTLRKEARENQVTLRVVRNTLAKLALDGTEYECVKDTLAGPSLFGFSMEDPGAAARLFKDFAKDNEEFEVKALAVGGQMLGAEQLDVLAKLPTRDQGLSMLMSVMKAPTTKLVQTMNEVPGKLVRTLAAVRDQKEAAA